METPTRPEEFKPDLKEEYVPSEWSSWLNRYLIYQRNEVPSEPIDIIAVQGLASTYERTWTKEMDDTSRVMWLKDLLPQDLPHTRILTFEYGSKWLEDPDFVTLDDCARGLLRSIIWDRTHAGDRRMCEAMGKRPLILLGHSYGGLVIKKALCLAAKGLVDDDRNGDYQSILTSISGIIFLGTPHKGSNMARLGVLGTKVWSFLGYQTNSDLLKPLETSTNAYELRSLHEEFQNVLQLDRLEELHHFYFWETKSLTLGLVVDQESACYGAHPEWCEPLAANHMEMNKFGSREESNYKTVLGRLQTIVNNTRRVIDRRWGRYKYNSPDAGPELKSLRGWLSPSVLASRIEKLQCDRWPETCTWALNSRPFSQWNGTGFSSKVPGEGRENCCWWIHGKPGSGKSVLSAYLYGWIRERVTSHNSAANISVQCYGPTGISCQRLAPADNWAILYFTFQGSEELNSVLATLIHQLLMQQADNKDLLEVAISFRAMHPELSPEVAINLLKALVMHLHLVYVIVDGIDECNEGLRLLELLKMLCTTNQVRLLLLSRDEVTITRFVKKEFRSIEMITDIVLNNRSDISRFITEQVRQLVKEKQFLAKIQTSMTETLEQQACGMFQWVKLVADALKYCETEDAAIDILEHFPQDLHAAYQKTMHRLLSTPGFNAPRCVLALKWLVCAKRPMQLHELSVAMKIDEEWKKRNNPLLELTDIVESSSNSVLQYDDEVLESEFKRLLGPLAEFHRQINQNWDKVYGVTIHLCHHSLAQFLLHQSSWDGIGFNGLGPVPYYDPPFQESMVHALLTETCMKMMSSGESLERYLAEFYHPELTMTNAPFLNYAFENWTHHLQQSANLSDQLQNLIGWNEIILQQNLKLSLIVIGSLADIFSKIEIKKIKQLMQSIAVRDFQAKLLPATKAIADALPTLPAITEHLSTMISHTQSSNGRLARMRATRSQGEAHDLKVYALDSITIAETLKLIKDDPTLRENMESRMIHLRAASQQLRDLAISLSVDPIRGYIYRHVGNSGINPIPALAQTAHIVDIFMSYPVLPLMSNEIGGFQEQFLTEIGHPLYGPITSVRLELEERESRVLTPAFYKEHILNHYSFKKSEWSSIHLGVQIMEITDNSWRRGALDFLVLWWQAFVLKIPLTNRNGQARPSEKFADTKFRSFEGDTIGITDYVYFFPRLTVLYCIKVIMLMFPELERIFIQIGAKVIILVSDMPVKLRLLFRKGNSVYGFLFYIARLYMMPWLFASVRNKPLEDIQGVFNDPFQYKAAFEETSWKGKVFFLVQESIFIGITSTFGRISSNEVDPDLPWETYAPIYVPFFSLVSLEKIVFGIIYIAFDIIRFGAFLLLPNSWSWDQFTYAAGSILGQVIVKQLGIWGTLVFLSRLWLFQWLWGWLHLHSLLIKIIDLLKSLLELINWQPLSLHIRGISNVITQSLERLLPQLERGTMSILYSILYAAFFAVLFLLIRDPLRSYHGRRSCSEARRIALQSINTQDANQLLHWRAPTQRKDTLGLVDLENLEKLGSEEQREQGQ